MELEQRLHEREKAQEALLQEIVTEVKFNPNVYAFCCHVKSCY